MQCKKFYSLSTLFILCWWLIAFHTPVATEVALPIDPAEENEQTAEEFDKKFLLSIDREELKAALGGDSELMGRLISRWDIETEIACNQGFTNLSRLDRQLLLRSQLLVNYLTKKTIPKTTLKRQCLVDSSGTPFDLTNPPQTFLPQTYLSAELLLSLVPHEAIVALPKGMRRQENIYPKEFIRNINSDLDPFNSEKLAMKLPDVAIISNRYTHPITINILSSLDIPTYCIGDIRTIEEVEELTKEIGHLTGNALKGELLALFIKAAAIAIDNKRELSLPSVEKTLVLNYHTKFSLPGKETLSRAMIKRAAIDDTEHLLGNRNEERWSTPVTEGEIIAYNPEKLLIITAQPTEETLSYFYQTPLFQHIDAAKKGNVTLLDNDTQQTISHFALLAYYDLNNALTPLKSEE